MTAKLTIRIPDELHDDLRAAADQDQRSLNSEIVWLLRQALKEKKS